MVKRALIFVLTLGLSACASQDSVSTELESLTNFQTNTLDMLSSGLPDKTHFIALKQQGVTKVIDLIPGDRTEEIQLTKELNLAYFNIQVEWQNPTLANFQQYVAAMQQSPTEGKTLTHCKLNWRGATFTYLYRVTQLGHSRADAEQDMLAIWQPNETWQAFIDEVVAYYQ